MAAAYQPSGAASAAIRMNRMYRQQRHIYDLTRKYYLLGRDLLIDRLNAGAGDCVLEIGCGTGRNLIRAARRYPDARFFGVDISVQMLISANTAISRCRLNDRIRVIEGDATAFNAEMLFGQAQFERVFISYSLSMIPDWRAVLPLALLLLARDGELHIVDFGDFRALPAWFGAGMRHWLSRFDVTPRDELDRDLTELASRAHASLSFERHYGGYAQYAVVKRIQA